MNFRHDSGAAAAAARASATAVAAATNTSNASSAISFGGIANEFYTRDEIASRVAQELNRLSLDKLQHVYSDVNGNQSALVEHRPVETMKFLHPLLTVFQQCLQQYSQPTDAYTLAEGMSKDYVFNQDLRMMFLRAEDYNPQAAAIRMLLFFEDKRRLFGTQKLVQDITLDDLSQEDIICLNSGATHMSPHRDKSGRQIVVSIGKLRSFQVKENSQRAFFYIIMTTLRNSSVEDQVKGFVFLHSSIGATSWMRSANQNLTNSLPIRWTTFQMCAQNMEELLLFCSGFIYSLNSRSIVRYRTHFGTTNQCRFELMPYGIPPSLLPSTPAEEAAIRQHHHEWIKRNSAIAEINTTRKSALMKVLPALPNVFSSASNAAVVTFPPNPIISAPTRPLSEGRLDSSARTSIAHQHKAKNIKKTPKDKSQDDGIDPMDVLFGRGEKVNDQAGNHKFKLLIEMYYKQWENSANKDQKTLITEFIVGKVKEWPGRFMKRTSGNAWVEVDHSTAREKVAHALRNRRWRPPNKKK